MTTWSLIPHWHPDFWHLSPHKYFKMAAFMTTWSLIPHWHPDFALLTHLTSQVLQNGCFCDHLIPHTPLTPWLCTLWLTPLPSTNAAHLKLLCTPIPPPPAPPQLLLKTYLTTEDKLCNTIWWKGLEVSLASRFKLIFWANQSRPVRWMVPHCFTTFDSFNYGENAKNVKRVENIRKWRQHRNVWYFA